MGCYLETPLWGNARERRKLSSNGGSQLLHQLHTEIMDFYELVSPTQQVQHVRISAASRFQSIAKLLWPSCEVRIFGSSATGLYLPSSDIDLVIFINPGYGSIKACLKTLADCLLRFRFASHVKVISTARVPIVKFQERQSGISFDVSFEPILDSEDIDLSRFHAAEMVRQSLSEFPAMGPLYMVLKTFMEQKKLNEVYHTGGMASYTLFVMIKAFLQMHSISNTATTHVFEASSVMEGSSSEEYSIEDGLINSYLLTNASIYTSSSKVDASALESAERKRARLSSPLHQDADLGSSLQSNLEHGTADRQSFTDVGFERDKDLGFLLLGFFHFYGFCLNTEEYGISCAYGGSFFFKANQGFYDPCRPYLLAVEDPFTPSRDIGKNSFNYQGIQAAFIEAYECLISNHGTSNLLHCILPLSKGWATRKGLEGLMKHVGSI